MEVSELMKPRKIKFRGKPSKDEPFVYGNLCTGVFGDALIQVIENNKFINNVVVLPETVGQYINVKGYEGDYENRKQNEVELFEGDIVEAMSEGSKGTFVITFRNGGAPLYLLYPNYQSRRHWNIAASDLGRVEGDYYDDLKRIGNIHDNPELVKYEASHP